MAQGKTIIQYFEGKKKVDSFGPDGKFEIDLWADTNWESIEQARTQWPQNTYRLVTVVEE